MKKIILSVFMILIMLGFCSGRQVYASELNKIDIYLDGFPCTGSVVGGSSEVNVYDIPSYGEPVVIDTLPVGSSLTITSLNVLNNSTNYYYVNYAADDTVKYGYIIFEFVEPVDAVITPAPGSDLEYTEPDLSGFFNSIKEFIYTVIDFFGQLYNCIFLLFPFFTDSQVNFLITFISIFLGLGIYLLFRKVTI